MIRRTWSRWWRRLTWSNASGRMTDQGGDLSPHSTTPDDLCCLSLQSGALPFAFIMYRLSALTFIARIGSATTRSTFVGAMSGHEGADVPDTDRSVALDAARLLAELRRTLGMPAAGDQRRKKTATMRTMTVQRAHRSSQAAAVRMRRMRRRTGMRRWMGPGAALRGSWSGRWAAVLMAQCSILRGRLALPPPPILRPSISSKSCG